MRVINSCMVRLQRRGITLSDCRFSLDILVEQAQKFKDGADSALNRCKLNDNKLKMHADIATDSYFAFNDVNSMCSPTLRIRMQVPDCDDQWRL